MVTATKTKAAVTLDYGENKGSYTFSGLLPEVSAEAAYYTAYAINLLQTNQSEATILQVTSKLVRA